MGQDESCGTTQFDAHASAFFHTRLICAVRITGTVPVVATCRMGVHSTLTRPFPLFRAAALPPSAARCTPYHRGTFPVHRFYGAIITGNTLLSRNFLSNFAAFHLTAVQKILIIAFAVNRGVAQLVARLVRDQEAVSSSLISPTTSSRTVYRPRRRFLFSASRHSSFVPPLLCSERKTEAKKPCRRQSRKTQCAYQYHPRRLMLHAFGAARVRITMLFGGNYGKSQGRSAAVQQL